MASSSPFNISAPSPFYHLGDFVDVLVEGIWEEAVIQGRNYTKKGTEYLVMLINKGKKMSVLYRHVRPSLRFTKMLADELSEEMPDPTQESTTHVGVSQEPWNDRSDFVNPEPMKAPPPKRFKSLSDKELNKLQAGAKAESTHKHTAWGLKVFQGNFLILFNYFFL